MQREHQKGKRKKYSAKNDEQKKNTGEKKQDQSYQDQRGAHPESINQEFAPTKKHDCLEHVN